MLNGRKTYIGIGIWLVATLVSQFWPEFAEMLAPVADAGLGIMGFGFAHKLAKGPSAKVPVAPPAPAATTTAALLVVALMLAGCNTLPVEQTSKESAGASEVSQKAESRANFIEAPPQQTIHVSGDYNVTYWLNGAERSNDIAQTNSGSTTSEQASSQGTESTPTASPTTNVTVPATGGP